MNNQDVVAALAGLTRKLTNYIQTGTGITWEELNLAEGLAEWYDREGRALVNQRARERAKTTPVEIDELTVSVKWGGKDGKWRWLAEASDGQAVAGEERVLSDALWAGHAAAYAFMP